MNAGYSLMNWEIYLKPLQPGVIFFKDLALPGNKLTQLELCGVGTVSSLPVKQHFGNKDQQQAYARGCCHFCDKVKKVAKIHHPFYIYQHGMMDKGEQKDIYAVWRKTQAFDAWFKIANLSGLLRHKYSQDIRPEVGDKYAGDGMKPGGACKIIHGKAEKECNDHKRSARGAERQP